MLLSPCPSLSLSLFCLHHYLDNSSKGALSLKCFCDHGVFLSLSLSLSLCSKVSIDFFFWVHIFIHWVFVTIHVFREFRSLHGWKPSTPKNSLLGAPITKQQRRMRKTFSVWIVVQVFAPTVCLHIDSTGFFRFVDMYIMMLFGLKIFRSS